jgi:hypothetical protein
MRRQAVIASNLLPIETEAQVFRALGHAVARYWSELPHDLQHGLFKEAVAFQGEPVRQSLAVFYITNIRGHLIQ